jgi:predicted metal-dependent hydrolase
MKKEIEMEGKKVEYTLKQNGRLRNLRIAVYCDGSCVVSAPKFLVFGAIEKFIRDRSDWIVEKLDSFMPFHPIVRASSSRLEYLKYKDAALQISKERCAYFNSFYKFTYNKITVRNQKTRWGSCSKRGNLNFNYKIALLPVNLADYLVVHELCHLGEFNHSQRFWGLVEKTIPDYKILKKELSNFRVR